jgi:hypothetical protein
MEKAMKKSKLPKIDSIEKLAEFWDKHDLTDFKDDLEEVPEPVFVSETDINIHLKSPEAKAVRQMARAEGVEPEELIRAWVLQELARGNNGHRKSRGIRKSRSYPRR